MNTRSLFSFLIFCWMPFIFQGQDFDIQNKDGRLIFVIDNQDTLRTISIDGDEANIKFINGEAPFVFETDAKGELVLFQTEESGLKLYHFSQAREGEYRIRKIPLWLSIFPPLIAIGLALIFKEVYVSLFMGVWVGSFIIGGLRIDSLYYIFVSIWETVAKYVMNALNDGGHLSIVIFSLLIGGMVAIISRNGGMAGVVLAFSKYARSPRSSQFITWLLGVAIFFDDYANTLIVGNTMRPITDKFRVSREKLAYIVDSTAAPVAAIAFITTWIGAELSYIDDAVGRLADFTYNLTPYSIFVASLKYSFYPILALIFIFILIYTKKDYGPMWHAEYRARTTGQLSRIKMTEKEEESVEDLSPVPGAPLKWYNAAIPVFVVIFMTIFGLVDTGIASIYAQAIDNGIAVNSSGWGDTWAAMNLLSNEPQGFFMKIGTLIGASDSYTALLWSSLSGLLVAVVMTLGAKIMQLQETIETIIKGFKTMFAALMILTLAWALAATTDELYTANYLTVSLQDSINPYVMPMLIFILAASIAFSTGSSWSTMAILYPIAIPTTWAICQASGLDAGISLEILLNVIAVTLAASVLGDHISPISDTTILSSLASECNHIDHVRTQLPYALTVGAISLVAGGLSTFFGGGWLISFILLIISVVLLLGVVWKFGKRVEA